MVLLFYTIMEVYTIFGMDSTGQMIGGLSCLSVGFRNSPRLAHIGKNIDARNIEAVAGYAKITFILFFALIY